MRRLRCAAKARRRLIRAVVALATVAAGFLGLSTCGEESSTPTEAPAPTETATTEAPPTLSSARVEAALKKSLDGTELLALPATLYPEGGGPAQETEVGGGRLNVRSVTCPEDVHLEEGGTFTCEVNAGKQDGSARVTQLDSSGKRLRYRATFESSGVETTVRGRARVK